MPGLKNQRRWEFAGSGSHLSGIKFKFPESGFPRDKIIKENPNFLSEVLKPG
jgi:hypothetical protein